MFDAPICSRNAVLAALPDDDRVRVAPYLERVALSRGERIHEPHLPQRFAYFPVDCLFSLQYLLENGAADELAVIGSEGMVGMALLMGGCPPSRAVVRRGGYAWRIRADWMRAEFRRTPALQQATLCFCQALMTQIAQTAVCNRHHTVDQQLCRWLLLSLDRLPSNELRMTHEQISTLLGVRREGITEAVGRLQRTGVIRCSRGRIEIVDRAGLESAACECYGVISGEYARLRRRGAASPTAGTHYGPQPTMTAVA